MRKVLMFLLTATLAFGQAGRPPVNSLSQLVGTPGARGLKDLYLAIRTDNKPGVGTAEEPLDASTAIKFDTIMDGLAVNSHVILQRNAVFLSNGVKWPDNSKGWTVKSGLYLQGNNATIRLATYPNSWTSAADQKTTLIGSRYYEAVVNDVVIEDVTTDANWQNLGSPWTNKAVMCVGLYGSRNTLRKVHAINMYGDLTSGTECFALAFFSRSSDAYSEADNSFIDCTADGPQGTYQNAFCFLGENTSYPLLRSRIIMSKANGAFHPGVVNIARVSGFDCINNVFDNADAGVYQDTGTSDELHILLNVIRCKSGILLSNVSSVTNAAILENVVRYRSDLVSQTGIGIGTLGSVVSVLIGENDVARSVTGESGQGGEAAISSTGTTIYRNNKIDVSASYEIYHTAAIGASGFGNHKANGAPISRTFNVVNLPAPGASTVGSNLFLCPNPNAARVITINSSNGIDLLSLGASQALRRNAANTAFEAYIGGDMLAVNNLSDINNPSLARGNLGLGTVATLNTGTTSGTIPVLDGTGKLAASTLPATATTFKGVWNANTNSPTITSSTGTLGWFYFVGTAGATTIDGLSSWAVGDQIIFDGSVWKQVPAATSVTSVAGRTGVVVLAAGDIASGTIATARLGSGTASNKTVLYGDQVYRQPTQLFDTAGTPKLSFDSVVRKLYAPNGTDVAGRWDNSGAWFVLEHEIHVGPNYFNGTTLSMIGNDGNSSVSIEPGPGLNGMKLAEGINGNYVFQVDPDTGQVTIGGDTTNPGKLSLTYPTGIFTVTDAAATITANRTIQKPNASGTYALTVDIPTRATGIDAFLATPNSANLRAAVTDEHGTGVLEFAGSADFAPPPVVTTVAFSTTVTPAVGAVGATMTYIVGALTNNLTVGAPTGTPTDGQVLKFRLLQDSTGGRTVTWNSAFVFGTDITAAMEPNAANAVWRRAFEYNAATSKWECVGLVRGF